MLLVNHALTGALIGLSIESKAILPVVSLASHFALDAMPHFGHREKNLGHRRWLVTGWIDGLATAAIVVAVCVTWPHRLGHLLLGIGFAILPDLFYIPEVLLGRPLTGWFGQFHAVIQWAEMPMGWLVEAAWAVTVLSWLSSIV